MTTRYLHEVLELDRDCELGEGGERAVVTELDGIYMTLVFPNRPTARREVHTGSDYLYLRSA